MGIDLHVRDIKPAGAALCYASPKQLRSLQYQFESNESNENVLINGQASDIFSAGVVLYEALTIVLPFLPTNKFHGCAPDSAPPRLTEVWVD